MNDEQKKDFRALAPAIAKAMGATLTRKPDEERYWNAKIETAAGLPLHVAHSQNEGKLRVSVDLPGIRNHDGHVSHQSAGDLIRYGDNGAPDAPEPLYEIGVSAERTPEKIAADITRRLIPGATELYRRACKRRDDAEAYTRGTQATVALLAKRLRTEPRQGTRLYPGGITLDVGGPDSVRIEHLSCTAETALKIVALLKAEEKGGE